MEVKGSLKSCLAITLRSLSVLLRAANRYPVLLLVLGSTLKRKKKVSRSSLFSYEVQIWMVVDAGAFV